MRWGFYGGSRILGCLLLLSVVDSRKIIDLSHVVKEGQPRFPTLEPYKLNVTHKGPRNTYWYQIENFSSSSHYATHLDSPCHFYKDKKCVSDIPLEDLVVPGVVVDIRHKVADNNDYALTTEDLQAWETTHGHIPDRSVLLVMTGWDRHWEEPARYLGSLDKDISKLHFPGVAPDAARWLAANRKLVGIGIDTISLDAGQTKEFQAHTTLAAKDVYNLENLRNLDQLPPKGFTVYALPVNMEGTSGAPARVVAQLDDPNATSAAVSSAVSLLSLLCVFLTSFRT